MMANHTKYFKCSIEFGNEKDVETTIDNIGNNLTKFHVKVIGECWEYWLDGVNFFDRVLRKCPNLQTLHISSGFSPNLLFGVVLHTQQQLEHLSIRSSHCEEERVNKLAAVDLPRGLKLLQSFRVRGVDWNCTIIYKFLCEAEELKSFTCEIIGCDFKLDNEFLDDFRYDEDPEKLLSDKIVEEKFYTRPGNTYPTQFYPELKVDTFACGEDMSFRQMAYCDTYPGEADFWGQE